MRRVIYNDEIGLKTVDFLQEMIKGIKEHNIKKLELLLTSGGGTTQYNRLIKRQIEEIEGLTDITVINIDCCASAAFDLYMSFTKRKAEPGCTFMIHAESYTFKSDSADFVLEYIQESVDLDSQKLDRYFDFFNKNGVPKAECREARRRIDAGGDFSFGLEKAKRYGVVNA